MHRAKGPRSVPLASVFYQIRRCILMIEVGDIVRHLEADA